MTGRSFGQTDRATFETFGQFFHATILFHMRANRFFGFDPSAGAKLPAR
jgi:hypothetical protein